MYVVGASYWQSAASGTGVGLPGMIVSSVWKRFACSVRDPISYGPAGSSELTTSAVATLMTNCFAGGSPWFGPPAPGLPQPATEPASRPAAASHVARRINTLTISTFPQNTPTGTQRR